MNDVNSLAARGFLKSFVAATGIVTGLWMALVLAFDPYLAFGTRLLPQAIIQPASRMLGDEQIIKDHLFQRIRPDTVIIGSSRSVYGLDPASPNLAAQRGFNLGMLGASLTEIEGLAAQVRRSKGHVKRLVIGIDYFMFFQKGSEGRSPADVLRTTRMEQGYGPVPIPLQHIQSFLLSTKVAKVMEDILDNWRRRDTLGEANRNGLMHGTYRFRIAPRERTFEVTLRDVFGQGWYNAPDERVIAERLRRLAGVIRSTCAAGIQVDALLSPEHAMLHKAAVLAGQLPRRQQLRRDVARLMALLGPELGDCLRYRDASGLNAPALEPLRLAPGATPQFIEVSHYAPVVGERLMLGFNNPADPQALGVNPARGELEADIRRSEALLNQWRMANPDDAAFVKRMFEATVGRR